MVSGPPMIATASPLMPTSAQTTGETACAVLTAAERAGEGLAHQRAQEQRGEEQPAAEAGADRDRRGDRLQHHQQRDVASACMAPR